MSIDNCGKGSSDEVSEGNEASEANESSGYGSPVVSKDERLMRVV